MSMQHKGYIWENGRTHGNLAHFSHNLEPLEADLRSYTLVDREPYLVYTS